MLENPDKTNREITLEMCQRYLDLLGYDLIPIKRTLENGEEVMSIKDVKMENNEFIVIDTTKEIVCSDINNCRDTIDIVKSILKKNNLNLLLRIVKLIEEDIHKENPFFRKGKDSYDFFNSFYYLVEEDINYCTMINKQIYNLIVEYKESIDRKLDEDIIRKDYLKNIASVALDFLSIEYCSDIENLVFDKKNIEKLQTQLRENNLTLISGVVTIIEFDLIDIKTPCRNYNEFFNKLVHLLKHDINICNDLETKIESYINKYYRDKYNDKEKLFAYNDKEKSFARRDIWSSLEIDGEIYDESTDEACKNLGISPNDLGLLSFSTVFIEYKRLKNGDLVTIAHHLSEYYSDIYYIDNYEKIDEVKENTKNEMLLYYKDGKINIDIDNIDELFDENTLNEIIFSASKAYEQGFMIDSRLLIYNSISDFLFNYIAEDYDNMDLLIKI